MALYPFWLERATLSIWASGGWRDRGMDSGTLVLFIHTDKPWKKSSVGCVWSCNWTADVYEHNLMPFGCKRDRENCPDQYLLTPCQYMSHSFWDTTPRIIRDLSENAHNVCIVVNVHIHVKNFIYTVYIPRKTILKLTLTKGLSFLSMDMLDIIIYVSVFELFLDQRKLFHQQLISQFPS